MRLGVVCLAALLLTGCSDKAVREYAAQLAAQLTSYRSQLERNLQAEGRMYADLAGVFSEEAERDVYENLRLERERASAADARRLEATSTLFDEQEYMRSRVTAEFESTRSFYLKEMTLPEQATASLRRLEYNTQKLGALAAALDPFTRRPELGAIAGDLDAFRQAAQTEMENQSCRDAQTRVAITKESLANAVEAGVANVEMLRTKLKNEEALKSRVCPTK